MKSSGHVGRACVALGVLLVILAVCAFVDSAAANCTDSCDTTPCEGQPANLCGTAACNYPAGCIFCFGCGSCNCQEKPLDPMRCSCQE
jgi:hypothetical protein